MRVGRERGRREGEACLPARRRTQRPALQEETRAPVMSVLLVLLPLQLSSWVLPPSGVPRMLQRVLQRGEGPRGRRSRGTGGRATSTANCHPARADPRTRRCITCAAAAVAATSTQGRVYPMEGWLRRRVAGDARLQHRQASTLTASVAESGPDSGYRPSSVVRQVQGNLGWWPGTTGVSNSARWSQSARMPACRSLSTGPVLCSRL